jgi:hypothetical protein
VVECGSIVKSYLHFETSLGRTYSHLRKWWLALLHLLSSCLNGMDPFHSMWNSNIECKVQNNKVHYFLLMKFCQTWNSKFEKKNDFEGFSEEKKVKMIFFN